MNEEEIFAILQAMRDTIDSMGAKIAALEEKSSKVDEIDRKMEEEIIQPTLEKIAKDEDDRAFGEFHDKYGEKLDKYNAMLKSIEGDGFDATREAYEGWKSYEAPEGFDKPESADDYVDAFVDFVEKRVEEIKKDLGLSPDADVEVKTDGENTEVTVDGEPVEEAVKEDAEEKSDEPETEEKEVSDDDGVSDEEMKEIEEAVKDYEPLVNFG